MSKLFALFLCVSSLASLVSGFPDCSKSVSGNSSISGISPILTILSGFNATTPLLNSNKVFLFTINQFSKDKITYTFEEEYVITAVGIRQLFKDGNSTEMCQKSGYRNLEAIYNITYTSSANSENVAIEYPIGTSGLGRINPRLFLPYQQVSEDYVNKEPLKIAVKPTTVKTLTIRKETDFDEVIMNAGTFCLQFDLYGCKPPDYTKSHSIVLEYQMPKPEQNSEEEYTGLCSEKYCTGGRGKLVDKLSGGKTESILWKLEGPEYSSGILVDNKNLSVLPILFILDNVHYIETITIRGMQEYGDMEVGELLFVSVNGIFFDISKYSSARSISPWLNTNSLLLEFYIDVNVSAPWITLSEITFTEYTSPVSPSEPEVMSQTELIRISTISSLAILLFIFLSLSLVINFAFLANKKCNLCETLVGKRLCNKETQPSNLYHKSMEEASTYETITEDRHRGSTVYSEPEIPLEKSYNPSTSIIEMPDNLTYISTLPLVPEDKVPGYSHLEFSKTAEQSTEQPPEPPAVKHRPKEGMLTAAQRRSSYIDQHMLSDLK